MVKITKDNVTTNNLQFLNSLTSDQYPIALLFREHFKEFTPLQSLSELHELEVVIHNFRTLKESKDHISITWLFRSCILQLLEFPLKPIEKQDLEHLEKSLTSLGDEPLSSAYKLEKLITLSQDKKSNINQFQAISSLINLCLQIRNQRFETSNERKNDSNSK